MVVTFIAFESFEGGHIIILILLLTIKICLQVDWVTMNFVPFSEKSVEMVVELYRHNAKHPAVINAHVLQSILKVI